jgi:uncharacterized YccA/Bax inhibitor family protein
METNNPVLARMEKDAARNGGYAGFGGTASTTPTVEQVQAMYDAPSTASAGAPPGVDVGARMTIADVIAKTGLMFVVVVAFAVGAWQLEVGTGVVMVAMFGALGLGLWGAASQKVRPAVYLGYAVLEGIVLGGISLWYYNFAIANGSDQNIVVQAVIGTFAAFAAMLFLYATRIIKVGNTFRKMMLIGMVGYLFVALASLVASFFGVGNGFGFYGAGGLGLLLCVVGVGLAAFSLALDFDAIETAMAAGVPEQESWRAAFGIMVTLVWLYLELLRLFAILSRN